MSEWTDPMTAAGEEMGTSGEEMGTSAVDPDAGGAALGTPGGGETGAPQFDPDAGGPAIGMPGEDPGVAGDEAGSTAFGEEEIGGPGRIDEA